MSCPADINVPSKEQERLHKCHPLALSGLLFDACKMPVQIVPVIFGCTDVVSDDCITHSH